MNFKAIKNTLNNNVKASYTKLLILLSLCATLIHSCTKDNSPYSTPKTNYFYLTTAQLNQTPYFTNPAFDTISYTSDKGDTLTFVKTKTDTSWYCERATSNPDNQDQNCYQSIRNTYTTSKGNGTFYVSHSLKGATSSYSNKIEYYFNNMHFWAYDYWINWSGFTTYQENNFINNYNYKASIIIYITPSDTSISNKGYINKDFGLYLLNNKNENKIWTLKNP